jgi:hypothetical protein
MNPMAAPSEIDFDLALLIGDFGPGSVISSTIRRLCQSVLKRAHVGFVERFRGERTS